MKVAYTITGSDRVTTAYLVDPLLSDGSYVGTNKHTGLPVHLRWTNTKKGSGWVEVCTRKWDWKDVLNDLYEEDIEQRSNPDCICLKEENA